MGTWADIPASAVEIKPFSKSQLTILAGGGEKNFRATSSRDILPITLLGQVIVLSTLRRKPLIL